MGKLVVVKGDPVTGTDTHNVSGTYNDPKATTTPPPVLPYKGTGDYTYNGAVIEQLSDFVSVGAVPVALVNSQSKLNANEDSTGQHVVSKSPNFVPLLPVPVAQMLSLEIDDAPLGTGVPEASAGSSLLTIGGVKVLLDANEIDACNTSTKTNTKVTASGQSFVTTD
jgi:hypothetical protein